MSEAAFRIVHAEYVLSAPNLGICPEPDRPEIAIAGRSNVGKSSLINLMCNRRQLAKTSGTPGKTRAINYFDIRMNPGGEPFYLVDLPGYGYAKVSKSMKNEWDQSLTEYLRKRVSLMGLIHLIDSRHPPTAQDIQMRQWIRSSRLQGITVLTKCDKLKAGPLQTMENRIREDLSIPEEEPVLKTSASKRTGIQELLSTLHALLQDASVQEHTDTLE